MSDILVVKVNMFCRSRELNDIRRYILSQIENGKVVVLLAYCDAQIVPDEIEIRVEYYIIHLESGMMVNWYKHLGRTNTCSQKDRTIDDYYEFFNLFKEELDYFERRNCNGRT